MATILGGDNDDVLAGLARGDILKGGKGDDWYQVSVQGVQVVEAKDEGIDSVGTDLASYTLPANVENLYYFKIPRATLTGNALANEIIGGAGNDKLSGLAGDDTLWGSTGNDTLSGGDGADLLVGEEGDDRLDGGNGNDTLWGNMGIDNLQGGAGDDTLYASTGRTAVNGGTGTDTLWVFEPFESYTRLRIGPASSILTSTVTGSVIGVADVEFVYFNNVRYAMADVLAGTPTPWNDRLYSTANWTTLNGGNGNDTYVVTHFAVTIVEGTMGGTDTIETDRSYRLDDQLENLVLIGEDDIDGTGNAKDNVLTGNAGVNWLDGEAGMDTMAGGDGGDYYEVDNKGDVVIERVGDAGIDVVHSRLTTYTLGDGVENLYFEEKNTSSSTLAFTGFGNEGDNVLHGVQGNDKLSGNGGNDTLYGLGGNDSLTGGGGNDVLVTGTGRDTVNGGDGTDVVVLDGLLADYVRQREGVSDVRLTHRLTGDIVFAQNVELFKFFGNEVMVSDLLFNTGSNTSDTLVSTKASDMLAGGAGDDLYLVTHENVTVIESSKEGTDTVRANVSFTLGANIEKLELVDAALNGWGNALNNTITGNGADNYLDGGIGADTMYGGNGDDDYVVDNAGDKLIDTGGTDSVYTSLASYRLGAGIENVYYRGPRGFTGTGNDLDNDVEGWLANDRLTGGGGNDRLQGWGGADTLTGGAGADTFVVWLDKSDTVADFKSGIDHLQLNVHGHAIGNGDMEIDSGELVIVAANARTLNAAGAAAVIGTAQSAYTAGEAKLFVVDNGVSTAIFKFTSSGEDATVSAGELALVATLTGVKDMVQDDFSFGFSIIG